MKKTIFAAVAGIMAFGMVMGAGCGGKNTNGTTSGEGTPSASETTSKYAIGKELMTYESQLDALVKLKTGDIDVAVIDSVMANYYASTGDFANSVAVVPELILLEEQYGIAGRKEDKAFVSKINEALIAIADAQYKTIAAEYGLTSETCVTAETVNPLADATDDSWDKIVQSGKVVIGYTVFAPIAYEQDGALTGFDIELAKAVIEGYLATTYNVELKAEFIVISWAAKEALLENGSIDLIWNGLTITEQRQENMCITVPYLYNNQVAVVEKSELSKYTDVASMKNAIIGVEAGSAGEDVVKGE